MNATCHFEPRGLTRTLTLHVQRNEGDETRDLHEEIDEQRHAGVERERSHRRHVRERSQEETRGLGERREEHGRSDLKKARGLSVRK